MTIIGITGHRQLSHPKDQIKNKLKEFFIEENATVIISGLALGFDTLAAEVAVEMNIELIAAIPFEHQASKWNQQDQIKYVSLLEKAKDIYIHELPENGNIYAGYFGRNKWIVECSNVLIAYYKDIDGGTAHTWKEAGKKNIKRINLIDYLI
jgi:uncharacterized phage-like protein YoqJ